MAQIEVLKVSVTEEGQKKKYRKLEALYKIDGNNKTIRVLDFVNPETFKALNASKPGDQFDVSFRQNDKGFWEMASAVPVSGKSSPVESSSGAKKSTSWETTEERAVRQVLIVRQSVLSTATDFLASQPKAKYTPEDVIAVARQFEDFVFGRESNTDVVLGGEIE